MSSHDTEAMEFLQAPDGEGGGGFTGLADLLSPLGEQRFAEEFAEKKPFFIKRNRVGYFDPVISLEQIGDLLSSVVFYESEVRVAKDGGIVPNSAYCNSGTVNRAKIWSQYRSGATLVFEHLSRKHAGLLRLMSACEQSLMVPCRANAYITPPSSRGFNLHYDTHDVLILQVSGSKLWRVHDSPLALPHEEQSFRPEWAQRSRLLAEINLEPGDVLYLPRGYIHGASTNHDTSFHVTIGIRSVTLRDVYATALRRALIADPAMRPVALFQVASTDVDALRRSLLERVDSVDLLGALRDAEVSFLRKRGRPFDGRLMQVVQQGDIELDTRLRVSPGAIFSAFEHDRSVTVKFDRRSITLPSGVRPALDFVKTTPAFRPADLPGLEQESRLIFARTLFSARVIERAA
ncbi:cupin domain-containing protein [Pseudomonas sp. CGJS7]|uniref:cupin domain-containing protein n=1 Tax=Pseudomonas sp. CGJS7 TaxID=3109348 RepID=UPI00300BDF1F